MKNYLFLLLLIIGLPKLFAQDAKTLQLDRDQIEALFLQNNLELIAEKLNVDIADAEIAQSKLWNNPNLSISDINLWSTKNQREGEKEVIPPIVGSFARNTQFSIELSQLIQTANKRNKLINRDKVSKEIAVQEFEDVLRNLKVELRKSIYENQFSQTYHQILLNQQRILSQLIESYKKQVAQKNVPKSELLRLQAALFELENEINEVREELNEQQKTLKVLLNIDPLIEIEVLVNQSVEVNPQMLLLPDLLQMANEFRPDLKQYNLQKKYHEKSLAYEKSLRVPDVEFSANYDRRGGIWKDFVGFGISVDLPFFNRNQGAIKAARISKDQSQYLMRQQQNIIQHEVVASYNNYVYAYNFYKKIEGDSLLSELDEMLAVYGKNLLNRNISILEYIDFMETYKANKQTMLAAKKKVEIQLEELQYTVGTALK